ncbi:hypothetical protein HYALB_00013272 [Hymenoscyphus albidus]|uniref:Coiled-coil domain-containing protein 16 n=1 Tax=Hymenoscyphus albidus TaxID=595503 RepID=A0A9N9LSP3_9HELO|nr:hypothetical protein HYALB_00013272 [Hymenoscyphus albidus]
MTDVRSLLKNERASRRVQHKYASYTPTGTLLCIACHLQLKSESLWDGHLRSAGHIMRVQKAADLALNSTPEPQLPARNPTPPTLENNKKRKASEEDDGTETIRKKSRAANGLPENFFDQGGHPLELSNTNPINDIQIPSRPATPLKQSPSFPVPPAVDENEWAAFEADIAATEDIDPNAGVIEAKPISAAELEKESREERKERAERDLEEEKEDAARKMEVELEEMEGLEQRVRKLRERREALRKKESIASLPIPVAMVSTSVVEEDDDDDEEEEDEDDWDGFRMKG